MTLFLQTVLNLLLLYLVINVGYSLVFAFAAAFAKKSRGSVVNKNNKFLVLIAAYKGDEVIKYTAADALKQNYPRELFDVVVIADSLQTETITFLKTLDLKVKEVVFEQSTKSKSINEALLDYSDDLYDYAVVLDIDNEMDPNFLLTINQYLQNNELIVQGHRVAKNLDTNFAVLDALSEEVNNTIFRQGHVALGLSCAVIGSGFATRFKDFKVYMSNIKAIGGFDKELELRILADKHYIDYAPNAMLYDEKVQIGKVFQNQRRRWLSAQVFYLRKFYLSAFKQLLLRGNFDYFNKVFQFVLLPRVLMLGFTLITALLVTLFGWSNARIWKALPLVAIFSLVIAIPKTMWTKSTFKALISLPKLFVLMFSNLFRLKGANRKFLHTPHSQIKK